jgi:uncharacterized alkaline shock family protein YloU
MSETMHNLYGRARYDATTTQESRETGDPDPIDVEQTHAVAPADDSPWAEDMTEPDAVADAETTEADLADDTDDADADDMADDADSDDDTDDTDDSADDSAEAAVEDDVIVEDAAPVTVVPVTVESGDAAVESGDAPAAAEVEPADPVDAAGSDQAEPVVAVAEVAARPAAAARGTTTVGDGVVSKVVNMVARKAEGLYSLDDEDSSVTVDAGVATIRIALVVEYGHAVTALAERIRIDVVDAVEQFLGLDVAAVDVHVSDIHEPEAV